MAMNFRRATDELLANFSHEELAKALGVSVATVRQARLTEAAKAHRTPPPDWERVVLKLAGARMEHFQKLVNRLGAQARSD
jgi:flagellar biosynthesis regulator FlbT